MYTKLIKRLSERILEGKVNILFQTDNKINNGEKI